MSDVLNMTFFVSTYLPVNVVRQTRTTNPAKAFSLAMNAPKPVNITVWRKCDDPNYPFYPSNFVCDTNEEVYSAFSLITSISGGKTL